MTGRARLVSVIVPIGRMDVAAKAQIAALDSQEGGVAYEIILSCNTSISLRQALTLRADGLLPTSCQVVDASHVRGPSYARNIGWKHARGDLVLFCDADDVVAPDWIAKMSRLSERYTIFGGALEYERLNWSGVQRWNHNWNRFGPPVKFEFLPFVPSCNLGIGKVLLEQVGGWDEQLTACEDTDLCWRAQLVGHELGFSDEAVVHYRLRRSLSALARQQYAYGRSDALLRRKYIEHLPRPNLIGSVSEVLRTLAIAGMAVVGLRDRRHGITKLANLAGRVVGTAEQRVWVL